MDRNLIDYLPQVLKEIRELRTIFDAEQIETDNLWNGVYNVLNDQFVELATENGIERWEKILKITPKATETLDNRRFTILTRLSEELPYTMRTLERQLSSLCGTDGFKVELQNDDYKITVKIDLIVKSKYADVDALLHRVIPANMIIELSLIYNQHEILAQYTHSYLSQFTHYELRNEVVV